MRRPRLVTTGNLLLFLAAVPLHAQTIDPQVLLDQARLKVSSTVQHAPRYTCMETIERYWYVNRRSVRPGCDTDRPPQINDRDLVRTDRLRLDVAVGSGQEMFSWHGQKSFQTEEIDQLITAGPISSGTYFSFLSSIFLEGVAKIDFRGVKNEAGKQLAAFGYSVPISESKFETRTDSGKDVMGYHGEFFVDRSTGELERLSILTDDMPESAQVCSFNSEARYGTTRLNGAEFQLPINVVMDILHLNREQTRTVTQYRECRQFVGESVLRFDNAPAETARTDPRPARTLPAGLQLQIRITSAMNPTTAWAGDPLQGELAADVFDEHGTVLAPRGTPVEGRLLRVETWVRPAHFYTVALQFRGMRVEGEDYKLDLKSTMEPLSSDREQPPVRRRIQLSNPPISDDPAACRFRLSDRQVNLKGVITYWITN
ncbi:MAG: hypothetical protein WB992_18755 [Bryobacteraceae bacterium]